MFEKWTQYSYAAQKNKRNRFLNYLLVFILLYITYNCLVAFFFSVWVIENNTMQPGLNAGDRLIFSSFTPPAWSRSNTNIDFKRGSIVIIDKDEIGNRSWPLHLLDGFVRFFTAQKISIFSGTGQYYIKRVIALPGDEVSMRDYVFRVTTSGNSFSLTEFELSDKPYSPGIPVVSVFWDSSVPFSGNMDVITMGANEIFVVSDDRANTNDSRTWGPISSSQITARAVLRFWPLNKIELF
jgi:signal peptidase I